MRHRKTSVLTLALILLMVSLLTGCMNPPIAHDPAKQAAISSRQVLLDTETAYVSLERQVVSMRHANVISAQVEMELVAELHANVRPLIDLARQILYAPTPRQTPQQQTQGFNDAITKAGRNMGEVGRKIPVPPSQQPTSQPSIGTNVSTRNQAVLSPQHGHR